MKTELTAVIPLFNKCKTVEETVKSVLRQKVLTDNIVIVDDGSTDGSVAKVKTLDQSGITLRYLGKKGPGGYCARNHGVRIADTEWVGFLDADDQWASHHWNTAKKIIDSNPTINTIFCGYRVLQGGKVIREIAVDESRIYTFSELVRLYAFRNVFHINALIIRRETFLDIGGFDTSRGWRRGGDSEMFLRVIRDGGPVFLSSEITSTYHTDFSGVIGDHRNFTDEHPVRRTIAQTIRNHPDDAAALKRISNRKTIEWVRGMPRHMLARKLLLITQLHPLHMSARDWLKLVRDFSREPG